MATIRDIIQAGRVQPIDVGRAHGTAAQTALTLRDLADRKEAAQERGQLRELAGRGDFTKPGPARDEFMAGARRVAPIKSLDIMKFLGQMDATTRAQRQAEAPALARLLAQVNSQETLDLVKGEAGRMGMDVSDWPTIYDRGQINIVRQVAGVLAQQPPMEVSAGATLVDPVTREPVFTAPKAVTPTSAMKNAAALNLEPGTPEYDDFIRTSSTKPSTQVNLTEETAFAKGRGEANAKFLDGLAQQADEARNQTQTIAAIQNVLGDIETGRGLNTEAGVRLSELARTIGIDINPNLPALQAAQSFQNQLALRFRNPESGFGLTGSTSDRDLSFLKSIPPSIAQTPQGRRIITEVLGRIAGRKQQALEIAYDVVDESGGRSFNRAEYNRRLRDLSRTQPLFDDLRQMLGTPEPEQGGAGSLQGFSNEELDSEFRRLFGGEPPR